jgi:hypothetical protein
VTTGTEPTLTEDEEIAQQIVSDEATQRAADGDLDVCTNGQDHDWQEQTDWMGDVNVPNGTVSWTVRVCRKCGEERT